MKRRETQIIDGAKMDHQIDFENPNQVAIEANADSMKERYEVLKRKLTIMKGAVTN